MTKRKVEKINIYQLKAINGTNRARITNIGYMFGSPDFEDEEIIIDKTNNTNIKEIMENIYLKMYKCKMTDDFVSRHKKLPLMYASLFYQRKFVTGFLFSVYIYFEIITNTNKIQSLDSLLNTELVGKYTIEIVMDKKTEIIEMGNFLGLDETKEQLIKIIETDEMKNILKLELCKRDKERTERLGNVMDYKPVQPKYNFNELLKKYEDGDDINEILEEIK